MDVDSKAEMSFWDHLDALRGVLLRSAGLVLVLALLLFVLKDWFFDIVVLAPTQPTFPVYRLFGMTPEVSLINYDLTAQFMVHLETSLLGAIVLGAPYVCYELWKFIAPALYENERRYSVSVAIAIFFLFVLGVLMSYYVLFPFALRFLGTYQVAADVVNQINLSSYISTFVTLTLMMGLVFQLPVLSFFLAKMGVLEASFMRQYRRHAFVLIGVIAAVITPPDLFTCFMVMIPMYGLYELSILIVEKAGRDTRERTASA